MKKEIELKYQLADLADFHRLMSLVKKQAVAPAKILKQKNIFFDTPGLELKSNNLALRLRHQNRQYFLCVKQSNKESPQKGNLAIRLEFEAQVSASLARLMEHNMLSPLEVLGQVPVTNDQDLITRDTLAHAIEQAMSSGLQLIGSFTTTRTKISAKLGSHRVIFELDQVTYPDQATIFEAEIEFASEQEAGVAKPLIDELLEENGLKTRPSVPKSSRLYEILFGA